jgi:HTH-type transcriptional regulator/antitoxin HigA
MHRRYKMTLKPIKTDADYEKVLARVDTLMELNPELGTKESDELEILVMLVEKYESEHWCIADPDPIEAIKFRMEQLGLEQKDLVPYIGSKSKVSEVLNRKIGLSVSMMRNLYSGLHIPLEVLINSNITTQRIH